MGLSWLPQAMMALSSSGRSILKVRMSQGVCMNGSLMMGGLFLASCSVITIRNRILRSPSGGSSLPALTRIES